MLWRLKMKRFSVSFMLVALVLSLGACSSIEKKDEKKNVLFYFEDAISDDKGAGNYTYPSDKIFEKGSFDIQEFTIYEADDYYEFVIRIGSEFKNYTSKFANWDMQMFDIYLQLEDNKNTMAVSGRNVKFSEAWSKSIVIAPERQNNLKRAIYSKNTEVGDSISSYEDISRDIIVPNIQFADYNTVYARVLKSNLDLSKLKAVQVFSMPYDGDAKNHNTLNSIVEEYTGQYNFGGGSNFYGNPNVIDILGDNKKLGDYISEEGYEVYPVIDFIKVK